MTREQKRAVVFGWLLTLMTGFAMGFWAASEIAWEITKEATRR